MRALAERTSGKLEDAFCHTDGNRQQGQPGGRDGAVELLATDKKANVHSLSTGRDQRVPQIVVQELVPLSGARMHLTVQLSALHTVSGKLGSSAPRGEVWVEEVRHTVRQVWGGCAMIPMVRGVR